jgi:hypothetical protein
MTTTTKPMNITFEIRVPVDGKPLKTLVTFYHIDAIYSSKWNNAVIVSGGKEWEATSTYGEIWDKIKKHLDESAT